jgi:hypothetical protein
MRSSLDEKQKSYSVFIHDNYFNALKVKVDKRAILLTTQNLYKSGVGRLKMILRIYNSSARRKMFFHQLK